MVGILDAAGGLNGRGSRATKFTDGRRLPGGPRAPAAQSRQAMIARERNATPMQPDDASREVERLLAPDARARLPLWLLDTYEPASTRLHRRSHARRMLLSALRHPATVPQRLVRRLRRTRTEPLEPPDPSTAEQRQAWEALLDELADSPPAAAGVHAWLIQSRQTARAVGVWRHARSNGFDPRRFASLQVQTFDCGHQALRTDLAPQVAALIAAHSGARGDASADARPAGSAAAARPTEGAGGAAGGVAAGAAGADAAAATRVEAATSAAGADADLATRGQARSGAADADAAAATCAEAPTSVVGADAWPAAGGAPADAAMPARADLAPAPASGTRADAAG